MREINIVVTSHNSFTEACAFTSPDVAIDWFKKLQKMGKHVSVISAEIDSAEPFLRIEIEKQN